MSNLANAWMQGVLIKRASTSDTKKNNDNAWQMFVWIWWFAEHGDWKNKMCSWTPKTNVVVGSNHAWCCKKATSTMWWSLDEKATTKGFEPSRAEPNGFRVHLLNHSDTLSCRRVEQNSYVFPCCQCCAWYAYRDGVWDVMISSCRGWLLSANSLKLKYGYPGSNWRPSAC